MASWQLPRLDSHQLADDSFQGTLCASQAALEIKLLKHEWLPHEMLKKKVRLC